MRGKHGDGSKYFGDFFRSKSDSVCRFIYLNLNGIGKYADSTRWEELKGFVKKHDVDAVGLSELNIDWRTSSTANTLHGRAEGCFQTRPAISVAHNTREKTRPTSNQRGGTAVMAFDKLSLCKQSVGQDTTRLGRWSWIRVRGENEVYTRIISVYYPNKPGSPTDKGAYNQQRDYFLSVGNTQCPQVQFWIDLKVAIRQWLDEGDQLVIGGDWNTGIGEVNKHLGSLGLTESITGAHGLDDAPKTFARGSKPIDGIYTTKTLAAVNCGYLPFYKGTTSDHRIIWVDIDFDAVLGFQMEDIKLPQARRLLLKDPRIWKKYNHLLDRWETKHNLIKKARDLLAEATYPITEDVHRKLEAIDNLRVQGMIYAEKRCRKIRKGYHPWSPEFSRARRMVKLWAMMRDRKKFGSVGARTILRLLTKLGINIDLDMSIETIEQNLAAARKEYANVKKRAAELRISYLTELAKAMAENEDHLIASKLRALIHIEEQRRIHRAIKFTTGKLFDHGTSRVLIPDPNGGNCEITGRLDLELEIIKENLKKYHRTESYCPLLHGQLLADIGICGDGPRVPDILDGTYVPPEGTPEGTRLFLESMKQPTLTARAKEKATRTSVDEFKIAWKRKRERSSSCGPLHYGHYKSACRHERLGYLHFLMAELFLETGCYLDRHRNGIDVMLLKAAGDYRIHRLRTICLFDAEYNMNNDRVSKAGLASAMEIGEIADEQYSRPYRSAIDHVVNRRLSFEYFAYRKLPFGICSCDLTGCYDRIVHAAASLALQRLGVPLSRITGMFDTIQRLVKRVRTAFGDSEMTYGGDYVEYPYIAPPQGVNQGNCNGPPVWSIISSTVFSVLRREGFGVKFITAVSHEIYHLCGFAYVDDSDLLQGGNSAVEVAEDLQRALDLWADVLRATGQALEPLKSWWYLVDLVWSKGEWSYSDSGLRNDLVAFDTDGNKVSLKRLMCNQSTKMLGVYLAPNGDKTGQIEYMKTKALEWAECIRVGHLGKVETRVALKSCIWKSLMYPMSVTTLSTKEINKIIWPILEVALPKIGICRNVATALRYGPKRLGGFNLINLALDQGIKKVIDLIDHTWKSTPTGQLISSNVQAMAIDCGIVDNPFEQDSSQLVWSTIADTWTGYFWKFIDSEEISISNLPLQYPSLRREGDMPIMTTIRSALVNLSDRDMQKINACRLHLRLQSVSDMVTSAGTSISSQYLPDRKGVVIPSFERTYAWPSQPCPDKSFWHLWKYAVLKTFCANDSFMLNAPLGDWIDTFDHSRPDWDTLCECDNDGDIRGLWKYGDSVWRFHNRSSFRRRRICKFDAVSCVRDISSVPHRLLFRADADATSGNYVMTHRSAYYLKQKRHEVTEEIAGYPFQEVFLYFICKMEESKWLFGDFQFIGDMDKLFRDFLAGNVLVVSDGSFSEHRRCASASWVIESADRTAAIRCSCITPGTGDIQNAYRAELSGILGASASIWALYQVAVCRGRSIEQCNDVVLGCDGYSALQKCMLGNMERMTSKHKHFDLIAAIRGIWRELPFSAFPSHIDGHRDAYFPYYALTRMEKMNVDMDAAAK